MPQLSTGLALPSRIEAQLNFGGILGPKVYYETTGLSVGDDVRFTLTLDASALPTGRHEWEVVVGAVRGAVTTEHRFGDSYEIFNRIDSEFGDRMWIDELDRLTVHDDGASLMRGDSTAGCHVSQEFKIQYNVCLTDSGSVDQASMIASNRASTAVLAIPSHALQCWLSIAPDFAARDLSDSRNSLVLLPLTTFSSAPCRGAFGFRMGSQFFATTCEVASCVDAA